MHCVELALWDLHEALLHSHLPSPAHVAMSAPPPPDAPPHLHSWAGCNFHTLAIQSAVDQAMELQSKIAQLQTCMRTAAHYLSTHGAVDMVAICWLPNPLRRRLLTQLHARSDAKDGEHAVKFEVTGLIQRTSNSAVSWMPPGMQTARGYVKVLNGHE